ncbi:cytochrome c oxidase assembly protein COX16 homolog, mitochondrial [Bacillus rossius redtenbacheri]|uniref:cytochrome c oxidase assembly protein COX16 homolog, mitochondrial n=1 Tax=Bacillus rossius redtenbacheri TaxID=93214 RepID=UPI002FDD1F07
MTMWKSLIQLSESNFFRYGLPFIVFVVGGSFGLKEFAQLRYDYSKREKIDPDELREKYGIQMKKRGEVTLESEYEKLKQLDIDNWSNIRISRPWEESPEESK